MIYFKKSLLAEGGIIYERGENVSIHPDPLQEGFHGEVLVVIVKKDGGGPHGGEAQAGHPRH